MNRDRLKRNLRIAIIGDMMVDQYITGSELLPSIESDSPVLLQDKIFYRPGGAANVALNIHSLDSVAIPVGIIGEDRESRILCEMLETQNITTAFLTKVKDRPTTLKSRFYHRKKLILRVDRECNDPVASSVQQNVIHHFESLQEASPLDGLIIQDYDKGLMSPELIDKIIDISRQKGIPIFVDPKFKHFWCYENVYLVKPNLRECFQALGNNPNQDIGNFQTLVAEMILRLQSEYFVLTLSGQGLFGMDQRNNHFHIPAIPLADPDVCGAGDAVIASLAVSLLSGMDFVSSCKLANQAGFVACNQFGAAPVALADIYKLRSSLRSDIR